MARPLQLLALLAVTALLAGCATSTSPQVTAQAAAPAPALQIKDIQVGTGAAPKFGQSAVVHYTGWLYEDGKKGKKFDSSVDRGQPFAFKIGQRQVIAGWDQGVASMRIGGKRTLIIPPNLAYGPPGSPPAIPPNATLIFDIELLDLRG
ncbi:MAG: FKBP-type peptidyl-prolyl cis-trans isomerase [Rhizobiales bacterium]|nr:FKBP-type peptidyl-prolyl cis-trans isomerase [Hyphomicrobiales bacterium]